MRPGIACASSTCSSSFLGQDHVDPREPVTAEQLVDGDRQSWARCGNLVAEVRRAHVVGLADLVARLEVEEVLLLGLRLHDR